jgi:hypothetical protein
MSNGGALRALRVRVRFDRNELSGAFGDIGTDLPLIIAMIAAAGLDAASVFIVFGLAQVISGLAYGLPMPMQPLKAMAVIVIAQGLTGEVLYGGGLAIGVIMLVLTASGALGWLTRAIPHPVVRGVQLGLGLSLASLALTSYVPAGGPWGYALAAACLAVIIVLYGNRRLPPALPVIAIGAVVALLGGSFDGEAVSSGVAFSLPQVHVPQPEAVLAGLVLLAIPQLPLSLANSVIATDKTLRDLFPDRKIGIRKIGLTYSLANLAAPFLSGIPVCHGCGGLAGHYAFGGRTGGSVIIYGSLYLVVGLFFGGVADQVVQIFPRPVLGVILLVEALALALLVADVAGKRREFFIALLVAVAAAGLPQGYVVGLVAGSLIYYLAPRFGAAGSST